MLWVPERAVAGANPDCAGRTHGGLKRQSLLASRTAVNRGATRLEVDRCRYRARAFCQRSPGART